jgi:hypothetical protein
MNEEIIAMLWQIKEQLDRVEALLSASKKTREVYDEATGNVIVRITEGETK